MPASYAGGIKTDAGEQVDAGEQADAERQAKKRLGVESAEHRTLHILPCGKLSMVGSSLPATPPVRSAKSRHFSIAEREMYFLTQNLH